MSAQAQRDLNHACYHGLPDMATDALARGADPFAPGGSGKCALHFAAMGGHGALCSHLAGLMPSALSLRDGAGQTALHLACRGGKAQAAMALCQAGSDAGSLDDFGRTPIDCCPDPELRRALSRFQSPPRSGAWPAGALDAALGSLHGQAWI